MFLPDHLVITAATYLLITDQLPRNYRLMTWQKLTAAGPGLAHDPSSGWAEYGFGFETGPGNVHVCSVVDFVCEHRLFLAPGRVWGMAEYSEYMIGHNVFVA